MQDKSGAAALAERWYRAVCVEGHETGFFSFASHAVSLQEPTAVRGVGLVAEIGFFDLGTYQGPHGELVVLAEGDIDADGAAARFRVSLASLQDEPARRAAFEKPLAEVFALPGPVYDAATFAPDAATLARREAALGLMQARLGPVREHVERRWGLRVPAHLAVFAAFCASQRRAEFASLHETLGAQPAGIVEHFFGEGPPCSTAGGEDERLVWRYRRDPPEFVTVATGDTDGLHWGLWYDEPAELPGGIVHNYARDTSESWLDPEPSLCLLFARRLEEILAEKGSERVSTATARRLRLREQLAFWGPLEALAVEAEGPPRWPLAGRASVLGGLGPALPPGAGAPRVPEEERVKMYRDVPRRVEAWIARAHTELAEGRAGMALVLGRELHWFDDDRYRQASLDLLAAAYERLGRGPLADIARVHHAHRDMTSVASFARDSQVTLPEDAAFSAG